MPPRQKRKPRKSQPVYCFIVEGYTEENYIKLLKLLHRKSGEIKNCKGGSARHVLETAFKLIESENRDDFTGYVLWFDCDRYDESKDSTLKENVLQYDNTRVYISQPCVENWLLAHFEPIDLHSRDCKACEKKLKKHIPSYRKNDRLQLSNYLSAPQIDLACQHNPTIGEIPTLFVQL